MYLRNVCCQILVTVLISSSGFAQSDKEKTSEKTSEKTPEQLASEQKYSGSQNEDWSQALNDLSTAKQKLINEEVKLVNLQNVVQNKEKMTTAEALEINAVEKNVKKYQKEYDQKNSAYLSQYPERGLQQKRTYVRPAIDEVSSDAKKSQTNDIRVDEKPQTVESQLGRLKSKINKQYKKTTELKGASRTDMRSVKIQSVSKTVEVHDLSSKDQLLQSPKLEK